MANQVPNHFKYLLATKVPDFVNDAFIIILMDTGFAFDKDAHALLADVSAQELGAGFGYLQQTKACVVASVTEDDVNDVCSVLFNNVSWTAGGGDIGPSPGAIIYDNTLAGDPIVGYIDFGAEYTQPDGGVATLANIEFRIK